jgi:hypothetical protein
MTETQTESVSILRYLITINDDQIDALSQIFRCELCKECQWTTCQLAGALRLRAQLQRSIEQAA